MTKIIRACAIYVACCMLTLANHQKSHQCESVLRFSGRKLYMMFLYLL